MDELKKNKNYLEAKSNQREGYSYMSTSCITCKFKPNYMDAIPSLRTAADMFFGFSKTNPQIYKNNLVKEEIDCREKLLICLEKESSLIDEGAEGVKLANIYINVLKNYDMGIKTMNNFNKCFIYTNKCSNNTLQRSLKNISLLSKNMLDENELEYAEKGYKLLYETATDIFPGQIRENEPYEYIYSAFYDYFEYLIIIKKYEECYEEIINCIKNISDQEKNVDHIITKYYKLLVISIILEDEIKFNTNFEIANQMKMDSCHDTVLDALKEIFEATKEGDEIKFREQLFLLQTVLNNSEIKAMRIILKKNVKYEPENKDEKKMQTFNVEQNNNLKKFKSDNIEDFVKKNENNERQKKYEIKNEELDEEENDKNFIIIMDDEKILLF